MNDRNRSWHAWPKKLLWFLLFVTALVAALLFLGMLVADHPREVQRLRAHLEMSTDWMMWVRFSLYALIVFVIAPGMARSRLEQASESSGEKDEKEKIRQPQSILSLQLQLLAAAVAVELLVVENRLAWLSDWITL